MKKVFWSLTLKKKKEKDDSNIFFAFTKGSYLLQLDFSLFQSLLYKTIQKDGESTC